MGGAVGIQMLCIAYIHNCLLNSLGWVGGWVGGLASVFKIESRFWCSAWLLRDNHSYPGANGWGGVCS
jgi:hypothetical protein